MEMRVEKFKNGKAAGGNEVTREMIESGGNLVIDQVWKLCIMAFEGDAMPAEWKTVIIIIIIIKE